MKIVPVENPNIEKTYLIKHLPFRNNLFFIEIVYSNSKFFSQINKNLIVLS
jgi:hypothetical protein